METFSKIRPVISPWWVVVTSHLGLWWVWAESLTQAQWSTEGEERERERLSRPACKGSLFASDLPRNPWTPPFAQSNKGEVLLACVRHTNSWEIKEPSRQPFLHTLTYFFFIFFGRLVQQTNPYKSYQGCVRKRDHTWRRLVPSFGPFLDFLTSDNVGGGWRLGAGTDCPSVRDTQSIATFTIVFLWTSEEW